MFFNFIGKCLNEKGKIAYKLYHRGLRLRTMDLLERLHQDHVDELSSIQVNSKSLYSNPSNQPEIKYGLSHEIQSKLQSN